MMVNVQVFAASVALAIAASAGVTYAVTHSSDQAVCAAQVSAAAATATRHLGSDLRKFASGKDGTPNL